MARKDMALHHVMTGAKGVAKKVRTRKTLLANAAKLGGRPKYTVKKRK